MEVLELIPETKQELSSREKFTYMLINQIRAGEVKLSYTAMSKFRESPRSFIDYKMKPKEQTPDMLKGSILHAMVLEPDTVADKYITDGEIVQQLRDEGSASPRATKKYKEWLASQTVEIVSQDIYDSCRRMADAVLENSASKHVLSLISETEVKIEFTHNGLQFIGFLDGKGKVVIDLKKCKDANPDKFRRDIANNGYWLQGGVYMVGLGEVLPYYLIAVDESCGVSVHELEDTYVEYGMEVFDRLTLDFIDCMDKNLFHRSFEHKSVSPDGTFRCSRPPYLS